METATLIKKNFYISAENIKKLTDIKNSSGQSAGETVRKAIDAFQTENTEQSELISIALDKIKEATAASQKTIERVDAVIRKIEERAGRNG